MVFFVLNASHPILLKRKEQKGRYCNVRKLDADTNSLRLLKRKVHLAIRKKECWLNEKSGVGQQVQRKERWLSGENGNEEMISHRDPVLWGYSL